MKRRQLAFPKLCYPAVFTFDPDVGSRRDGKDKEEEDENERLEIVGRYSFHAIENST